MKTRNGLELKEAVTMSDELTIELVEPGVASARSVPDGTSVAEKKEYDTEVGVDDSIGIGMDIDIPMSMDIDIAMSMDDEVLVVITALGDEAVEDMASVGEAPGEEDGPVGEVCDEVCEGLRPANGGRGSVG